MCASKKSAETPIAAAASSGTLTATRGTGARSTFIAAPLGEQGRLAVHVAQGRQAHVPDDNEPDDSSEGLLLGARDEPSHCALGFRRVAELGG